jgi:tRNA modification GTPase
VILTDNGALPPALDALPIDIVRVGKADLNDADGVSGLTGAGVDALISDVVNVLETKASGASLAIRARHREALQVGAASLQMALDELEHGMDRSELAAEELRIAIRALETLVGRIDVETLLDEIFASFCLGK